ncbi:RNA polymerase sigma factor [Actinomadura sp. HBU206391]|uniref:RNA polymerase sigma factor n=1 Tax=Actinomadura sp. HBU206391 TaxID=2731692 RepID=UPI00164F32A8|nr:RNA polymerase sigma factor [Actinomadura sp. HBU206391]MBC6456391.1 RNA polymerase sigma factor [Actinomadura sp. HBU206391]
MTADVGEQVTDAELAARFRRDPESFTTVYDRYIQAIHRYVAGRLDAQAAEDLAAETFCVAFDRRDRFDPERGNLRPWLFGIATILVARHRRKEARHYEALARMGAEPATDSHENRVVASVAAARMQPQLAKALAALSQGERDVVLLVALGQLSYDEVGEALGIPPGTVGSRLNRARTKLHDAIDQEAVNG